MSSMLVYVFLPYQCIKLGWDLPIQQALAKITLGDRFQRGALLCDSALSLPLAAQFDNYITWGILQFMVLGQRCPTVASVEAVIVIKTCCDSI